MKTIEIHGKNSFDQWTKTRTTCRGIVIKDGKLLLSYATKSGLWITPGGGVEKGESLEECCRRELEEETGYIVDVKDCYLEMDEYYKEWKFVSYFFVCELVGIGEQKLTKYETKMGLEAKWIPFEEALDVFSKHQQYEETDEERRGIYQREFIALTNLF